MSKPTRVARLLGQVVAWSITGVAVLVGLLLALPFIVLGWLVLLLAKLFQILTRREVDGLSDGGEPDALTEELARRIDGPDAAVVGRILTALADEESVLNCGCLDIAWPQHACKRCDWRTCLGHAGAHHYCVGDELPQRGAPLPAAVEASVNDAFARLINRSLGDLKRTDEDLARFYLIGDEK